MAVLQQLGRVAGWMAEHPKIAMGGIGATAGYIGSGGSIWGAAAGGALGVVSGRNKYWGTKSSSTAIEAVAGTSLKYTSNIAPPGFDKSWNDPETLSKSPANID